MCKLTAYNDQSSFKATESYHDTLLGLKVFTF